MDNEQLKVIYIHYVGVDSDGLNIYHFLINRETEEVFGDEWGEKPACNCHDLFPGEEHYEYIKELRTEITFDLAQKNCCFSMQDARDHVVALASENLDEYEEYPEPCRIVIHFGDLLDEVEKTLAQRDLRLRFI